MVSLQNERQRPARRIEVGCLYSFSLSIMSEEPWELSDGGRPAHGEEQGKWGSSDGSG